MKDKKYTYISLFSSAGVGCYGFKMEDFECVATNELIERRLNVQKFNHKCKYESGYICGDITLDETKKAGVSACLIRSLNIRNPPRRCPLWRPVPHKA